MPADEELLLASGRGDREAFALLVERHHRSIIQFVHRFLAIADRATAEDLAQQVFLGAWKYAPTFQPRAKVLTWLFQIATNTCLNYRRRERPRAMLGRTDRDRAIEPGAHGDAAGRDMEGSEQAVRVRAAVAALPPNQRAAIVLRYFHEFSYEEIAIILANSASAVDSLLHRARRALYGRLGPEKKEDSSQVSAR